MGPAECHCPLVGPVKLVFDPPAGRERAGERSVALQLFGAIVHVVEGVDTSYIRPGTRVLPALFSPANFSPAILTRAILAPTILAHPIWLALSHAG
jgi:hypothetical protein